MLTAGLGARAAHALNASTLQKALGVFMVLVAPTVPFKDDILQAIRSSRNQAPSIPPAASNQVYGHGAEATTNTAHQACVAPPSPPTTPTDFDQSMASGSSSASLSLEGFISSSVQHVRNGVLFIGAGSGFLAGLFGVGGGVYVCECADFCAFARGVKPEVLFRPFLLKFRAAFDVV